MRQSWRFLACVCLLQGAHAAYYGFSAIYWQETGYSASAIGYLWSLGVVAEVVIFALSKKPLAASARGICCCSPPFAGWFAGR
nr:3-phenylpropionic acid transporter [Raoultella sp. NCTC 9187]